MHFGGRKGQKKGWRDGTVQSSVPPSVTRVSRAGANACHMRAQTLTHVNRAANALMEWVFLRQVLLDMSYTFLAICLFV